MTTRNRPQPPRPRLPRRGLDPRALALSLFLVLPLAAAAEQAPQWTEYRADDTRPIDHGPWNALLDAYLHTAPDGISRFDYRAVSAADRQALDRYLETLQALEISTYSRDAQFAYWINLYNALTIQVVLDHYPLSSIKDIRIPGSPNEGPWDAALVTVQGADLSLNEIEHEILRPIWKDPRIHYAVNCASLGCPNLMPAAFTAENLDALLDRAAREFINHPRAVEADGQRLTVSSIFIWYLVDFGDSAAGLVDHLRHYAEEPLASQLAALKKPKMSRIQHKYDWTLNDVSR